MASEDSDLATWRRTVTREDAQRTHDAHLEIIKRLNEAAISTGQLALRSAMLMNGGAAAAVLAFAGTILGKKPDLQLAPIAEGLLWFGAGVFAAVLAMGSGYLTNYFQGSAAASRVPTWEHPYFGDGDGTRILEIAAQTFQWSSVALGVGSMLAFCKGVLVMQAAIQGLAH